MGRASGRPRWLPAGSAASACRGCCRHDTPKARHRRVAVAALPDRGARAPAPVTPAFRRGSALHRCGLRLHRERFPHLRAGLREPLRTVRPPVGGAAATSHHRQGGRHRPIATTSACRRPAPPLRHLGQARRPRGDRVCRLDRLGSLPQRRAGNRLAQNLPRTRWEASHHLLHSHGRRR